MIKLFDIIKLYSKSDWIVPWLLGFFIVAILFLSFLNFCTKRSEQILAALSNSATTLTGSRREQVTEHYVVSTARAVHLTLPDPGFPIRGGSLPARRILFEHWLTFQLQKYEIMNTCIILHCSQSVTSNSWLKQGKYGCFYASSASPNPLCRII